MNRYIRLPSFSTARTDLMAFRREEDGAMTIFGLYILLIMLVAAGIALDVMRSENERTRLQYTIDRAVLAAANVEQSRAGEEIVRDYLRAADLDEDLVQVTSLDVGSERRVTVTSQAETNTMFFDMIGIDELVQPVSSQARQTKTETEVSLVLDISGSMGGSKIESLRVAAADFVEKLLEGEENLTTISLVPYNDRVNAGAMLPNYFDFTDEHTLSNCAVFTDEQFEQLNLDHEIQRMGHFDFRTSYRNGNNVGPVSAPNCRADDYAAILPWSNNVSELQNRIALLEADYWTAMDLGVKWGTLFLDPSTRGEFAAMAQDENLAANLRPDTEFLGRPLNYGAEGTNKILVVMTDGVNTQQWDLRADRKEGRSNVFIFRDRITGNSNASAYAVCDNDGNPSDCPDRFIAAEMIDPDTDGDGDVDAFDVQACIDRNGAASRVFGHCNDGRGVNHDNEMTGGGEGYLARYSFWDAVEQRYWVSHLGEYRDRPFGGDEAVELDRADLFASLSMSYIANTLLRGAKWDTRVDYFYSWEETHNRRRADTNLSNICEAARDAGVVVYTIAFQAPDAGQTAMRDCAGGEDFEANYFNVGDLDIQSAFDDVLAAVDRLRLSR